VHFACDDRSLIGTYAPVRVTEALAHSCLGELLAHDAAQEGAHDRPEHDHEHEHEHEHDGAPKPAQHASSVGKS
jgi:hypothetical protein